MDKWWLSLRLILVLAAANSAPLAAKRLLGHRFSLPLDGGLRLPDGRPLLGPSKTIRGVVAALAAGVICAPLLGFSWQAGAVLAGGAMAGDALASFTKRRLGIASSGPAFGLDQVPESLLPLLLAKPMLDLTLAQIAAITLAFLLVERPAAWLAWRLGLRDEPY